MIFKAEVEFVEFVKSDSGGREQEHIYLKLTKGKVRT